MECIALKKKSQFSFVKDSHQEYSFDQIWKHKRENENQRARHEQDLAL
jgi:hypothetical protein